MRNAASGLPFDDIRNLVNSIEGPDLTAAAKFSSRNSTLTKPQGSLGRLEAIGEWVCQWQRRHPPSIERPIVAVFAGNHGVVAQGISAFSQAVTGQMVANFQSGGAAINQICKTFDLGLRVYELALDHPTRDFTLDAALEEADCAAAIAYGMEAIAGNCDLLCVGEMGIGNTTVAAAISHSLFGGTPEQWVGPGTGLDAQGVRHKADVVGQAVSLHRPHLADPLEILRRLGGREIAGMTGAILAARLQNVPVILDGYVATAAAAILHAMRDDALDHCLAAHCSAEPAHRSLLNHLGKEPLLDFGMRLGEGSGAALAAGIVKTAVALHNGMATFEGAGITNRAS